MHSFIGFHNSVCFGSTFRESDLFITFACIEPFDHPIEGINYYNTCGIEYNLLICSDCTNENRLTFYNNIVILNVLNEIASIYILNTLDS